jgi:hypothetical protein
MRRRYLYYGWVSGATSLFGIPVQWNSIAEKRGWLRVSERMVHIISSATWLYPVSSDGG